jgi:hypothetical protein
MTNLNALLTDEQKVDALTAEARAAIQTMVSTRQPVVSVDIGGETAAEGSLIVMLLPRKLADLVMLQMERSVKKAGA